MAEKSIESTSTAGSDLNHANIGRIHQEIRKFQSQQGSSSGVGKGSSGDSPASRTVERDGKNVTHLNFAGDDIFSSKLDGTQKAGVPPEHPATSPSTDRSQSTPPPERFSGSQADGAKEKSGIDNSTKAPKPGEPAQPETTGAKGHGNHPSHAGKSAEQSGPAEPKNDSPPPAAGEVGAPKGDAQPASPADRMLTPQPDGQVKPTDKTAERSPQAQESQSVGSAESTTHKHARDTASKHHSEKQAPATVPPAAPPPPAAKPTE